jgi:hypothetical protein
LAVENPTLYAPERFPIFLADSVHGEIYGLPIYQQPRLKLANYAGGERTVQADEPHDVVRLAHRIRTSLWIGIPRGVMSLSGWGFPGMG